MRIFKTLLLFILVALLPFSWANSAPPKKPRPPRVLNRVVDTICYKEYYSVLANDTNIRHGKYKLVFKDFPIERGQYTQGERTGVWKFYTENNILELEYDYDSHKPLKIQPHVGHVYKQDTYPSIFLGSPLNIRHYIIAKATYPKNERGFFKNCQVDVALHISSTGKCTGYHIERYSKEDFNESIRNALKRIPKQWRWLPARRNGKDIASEYLISIVFEYVE